MEAVFWRDDNHPLKYYLNDKLKIFEDEQHEFKLLSIKDEDSIDSFLRGDNTVGQVRQFNLNEKTKIKSERFQINSGSLIKTQNYLKINNWGLINQPRK